MKTICLVGNPNVGKTTLFNLLTGQHAATINASGTTVATRSGIATAFDKTTWTIVDMPGMYSKNAKKDEEAAAWRAIDEYNLQGDVIFVQIINATQWRHSLAVTLDLQQHGINPILLFNIRKDDNDLGTALYAEIKDKMMTEIICGDIEERGFAKYFWQQIALYKHTKPPFRSFSTDQEKFSFVGELFKDIDTHHEQREWGRLLLDRLFLHSLFGVVIFFAFMWIIFEATFIVGALPMDWIDSAVGILQSFLRGIIGDGFFARLLVDGLITGVGGTIVFVPNLLILFFFLSLLQQSGYLARTSYIFDVLFKKIGISGKASVHLLMGFGCNVPSIMATKSLDNRKEKIIVAMMTLFMSCSARLPVYALLISAFIPFRFQGITLFAVYLFGIIISLLTGLLLHTTHQGKRRGKLLAVIPRLVFPSFARALRYAVFKGKMFVVRIGKFIVPASIILWLLFSFPQTAVETDGIGASYGATISKIIEPVFAPLGFDWRITAGILSGLSAKEVMVASFAGLYGTSDETIELGNAMRAAENFSLPVALALLVFTLLYTPCIAVLGAIRAELGTRWMIFAILYPTALAWLAAFAIYHFALLFQS